MILKYARKKFLNSDLRRTAVKKAFILKIDKMASPCVVNINILFSHEADYIHKKRKT